MPKKVVVLLSGGLDSSTCLYWAKAQGYTPYCLLIDYGQRHKKELHAAIAIAKKLGVDCKTIQISLPWGGSALLNHTDLLNHPTEREMIGSTIPSTYVPGRNMIFITFAVSYAETIGAQHVIIGANAVDYSGYPDCRPEFFAAFNAAIALGTRPTASSIQILTPLIAMTKPQIAQLARELGVPIEKTWSCYEGGDAPCGQCESCLLREKALSLFPKS